MKLRLFWSLIAVSTLAAPALHAWDYEGHRLVNQVALAALPAEFPAFVRTPENAERVAFLAGEPDRWRNDPDLPLQQLNEMDHYLDMEELPLAGLDVHKLPPLRLDFDVQFAAGRAAHLNDFPAIDPTKNKAHTREWCGTAPWAITEYFGKLRSAFSYLRVYEELGTEAEIANARANIVQLMGIMGHYVGDGAQPLHTTIHHHGWVGANPNGYSTSYGIHQWIDGGFIAKAHVTLDELRPGVKTAVGIQLTPGADGRDPMFVAVTDYLIEQHKLVEPLYQLDKAGKLGGPAGKNGEPERPITPEGRDFIDGQLVVGGEMLASIWVTAWRTSLPDTFLRKSLAARKGGEAAAAK